MEIEKIEKSLFSSSNKALKQKLKNYIFEGKEESFNKVELSKIKFFNYSLYESFDIYNKNKTLKKSEDLEIVKKIFILGYRYVPNKLIAEVNSFNQRYALYKALKFSKEFVVEDINYTVNKNRTEYSEIVKELEKRYPQILEEYIGLENADTYFKLYLLGRGVREDKIAIERLEKFSIELLCQSFGSLRVKNILEYDLELKEFAQKLEDITSKGVDGSRLLEYLSEIYEELDKEKEDVRKILSLLEIIKFYNNKTLGQNMETEEFFKYVESSNLPIVHKIIYLYTRSGDYPPIAHIKKIIHENEREISKKLERIAKESLELASFILGVLISLEHLEKERKTQSITLLHNQLKKMVEELDKTNDEHIEVELVNSIGYMLTYCSSAKEELLSLYEYYKRKKRDLCEFINVASHYEIAVEEGKGENIWNILSKDLKMDIEFLIMGGINFVNIKNKRFFTEFLKENREVLYSIFDKKLLRGYALEEMLLYTYESSSEFEYKKLLPYLYLKDRESVDIVISVLKKALAECKEEVEKIAKGSDKVAKRNASILMQEWEKVSEKELRSFDELKDFVEKNYESVKYQIPYPELNAYSGVRAVNSEQIVDEKIVKYFVAKGIVEERYLKFLEIKDFKIAIAKIFEAWKKNGLPSNYLNIFNILLEVGEEYEVEEVVNACEQLIKKGRGETVIEFLIGLSGDSKKKIFSKIELQKYQLEENRFLELLKGVPSFKEKLGALVYNEFVDREELDLGFDGEGQKLLNYGNREIKLLLDKDLELKVINQAGKEMKTLPKYSEKFEDIEERVEFYTKEMKLFKKKREFALAQISKNLFYNMVSDKVWSSQEWKNMLTKNFFVKNIAHRVVWEIETEIGKIPCIFDLEKDEFREVLTGERVNLGKSIGVFYSGDYTGEVREELIKNITQKVAEPFLEQIVFEKVELTKEEVKGYSLAKYEQLEISYENLLKWRTDLGLFIGQGKELESLAVVFTDKLNSCSGMVEIKNNTILKIGFTNLLGEVIRIEELKPRFLSYIISTLNLLVN